MFECQTVGRVTHLNLHDLPDGCIKLLRVIEVDGDDMRPADVRLCIGMLRGHLGWGDKELQLYLI